MLVFYPLDFSPVCTDQLSVYQEVLPQIEEQGATLVGISVDSSWAHRAFRDKLGITIPLLSDFEPKGAVIRSYGAYLDAGRPRQPLAGAGRPGRGRELGARVAHAARDPRRQPDLRRPGVGGLSASLHEHGARAVRWP